MKPAPVTNIMEAQRGGSELFAQLLPLGIKKSVDKYHEDKAKLMLKFADELKDHDKAIQTYVLPRGRGGCVGVKEGGVYCLSLVWSLLDVGR